MINIKIQINYWVEGAFDDLKSAKVLIERDRFLHGLFFCHLVIEKIIKAFVVKNTGEIAPRSHNLVYLAEKANLVFEEDDEIFLGILMKYQLQGRYPDYQPIIPSKTVIQQYIVKTENMLKWLKEKL